MKKILILLFAGFVFANNSSAMEDTIQSSVTSNVVTFLTTGSLVKDFKLSKPEVKDGYYLSKCFSFFKNRMEKYKSCLSTFTDNILIDYYGLTFTPEIYKTFKFYFQVLFNNKDINFEIIDLNCVKAINFNLRENSIVFSNYYKN